MKKYIRFLGIMIALCALGAVPMPVAHAAPVTIDFETPPLGANSRQIADPYVDSGVTFTAMPGVFGDEVTGLVKNNSTSACVDPSDDNQKLGTGRSTIGPDGSIGLAGFPIKATFATPLAPPVNVSAEFQTLAGQPIRIRLFNAAGIEVGSTTDTANPGNGTCGFPGDPRARKSITATSATDQVAYAILDMDVATGGYVFVIDNFVFEGGPTTGTTFPTGPGDDLTQSLGSFRILVQPQFRPLMAGYPNYDPTTFKLQSPNLYEPNTVIGRSDVHQDADASDTGGTAVGTAGTMISDSDFSLVPPGFEGPPGTNEVHTEVRALNMTSWNCTGIPGVNVRAGIHAPLQPISPGEVEAKGVTDFPAESFFNVFAEIDLPVFGGFPGSTLYNQDPLLVMNDNLTAFPPRVVYVHVNSNAVPVYFRNTNPGFWNAGDLFGWLILAGHGIGFDCGDQPEFERIVDEEEEMVPERVEIDHFPFTLARITLETPMGPLPVQLHGPSTVHVAIDQTNGGAEDSDNDELDDVKTEMVEMNLQGEATVPNPLGGTRQIPVMVRLNPDQPSMGEIEEQENNTPGVLDVPPFTETGLANSSFDVWFEIEIEGLDPNSPTLKSLYHTADPVRMESEISHKPPRPGDEYRYLSTEPIVLLDENNEPSGLSIVEEIHTPAPPTERDIMETTHAVLNLVGPNGEETIDLVGPTWVHVYFEGEKEGDAQDDDGDGLEEVLTQMRRMHLTGVISPGIPVQVRLNPDIPTLGQIEEEVNNTDGTLDVPPFTDTGTAKSFFDVYFEIEVGGQKFRTLDPKRIQSTITHKPPAPGDIYEFLQEIPLYDLAGNKTDFAIGPSRHIPRPPVEVDILRHTFAQITLVAPDGSEEHVDLAGPSTVHVFFEGKAEGDAQDDDNNGKDEVHSRMVDMHLTGQSSMGPIQVRLNPNIPSVGQIEELKNGTPGVLDVPPFTDQGAADSFFDVYFEIQVGDRVFHTRRPKVMRSVITHKPPAPGDVYEFPEEPIPLLNAEGGRTGFFIGPAKHVPTPPVEVDEFEETNARITLTLPDGSEETVQLKGPSTVNVFFEGVKEGDALDDDGDNLDDVHARMVDLMLTGMSSVGPVEVRLNPNRPSVGQIEEKANNTPGRLDVPPLVPGDGVANSYFDVFFEIRIGGLVLHNRIPKRMQEMITHKPPEEGNSYENPQVIPLYDATGSLTGFKLGPARHTPKPTPPEVDSWDKTQALVGMRLPTGQLVNMVLSGPSTVEVDLDSLADHKTFGKAAPGPNDLEEVDTELVSMELKGNTPLGNVVLRAGSNLGLIPSYGQIEEKKNIVTGRLDLPGPDKPLCTPPTPPGCVDAQANSFFDVYFEVEVPGLGKLRNRRALRLESMINEKPPKARYVHVITEPIELYTEDGEPTGVFLVTAEHHTTPIEVDVFKRDIAAIEIQVPTPNGPVSEIVRLRGHSTAHVYIDDNTGEATDTDGDGKDQVRAQMVELWLRGYSSMGPVHIRLNPDRQSWGGIQEQKNNTEGTLDVPPFADEGVADSFFDVYVEIQVGDRIYRNGEALRMASTIRHKPPAPGDVYRNPFTQPIELLDENGEPTGVRLLREIHIPNPPIRLVRAIRLVMRFNLRTPNGLIPILVRGPAAAELFTDDTGQAQDTDDDGLDQVQTEMISMDLTGDSPLGPVSLRLSKFYSPTGEIEEKENKTPGVLDMPPYTDGGMGDSFFDIFVELEIPDPVAAAAGEEGAVQTLHTSGPIRLESTVEDSNPLMDADFTADLGSEGIELETESGSSSDFSLEGEVEVEDDSSTDSIQYLPSIRR